MLHLLHDSGEPFPHLLTLTCCSYLLHQTDLILFRKEDFVLLGKIK